MGLLTGTGRIPVIRAAADLSINEGRCGRGFMSSTLQHQYSPVIHGHDETRDYFHRLFPFGFSNFMKVVSLISLVLIKNLKLSGISKTLEWLKVSRSYTGVYFGYFR